MLADLDDGEVSVPARMNRMADDVNLGHSSSSRSDDRILWGRGSAESRRFVYPEPQTPPNNQATTVGTNTRSYVDEEQPAIDIA